MAFGAGRVMETLAGEPDFEKLQLTGKVDDMSRAPGARFYSASNIDLDIDSVDMVLTFRNYHNLDEASRMALN
ncbi:MAG: hypothetical protein ACI87W_000907 [Halieaceae bacterium]|jgi:hypothetical protein